MSNNSVENGLFWLVFLSLGVTQSAMAITIEEMSANNNKIIELDQNITLAKKAAELASLKAYSTPEAAALSKTDSHVRRHDDIYIESVHGDLANPTVTVLVGDSKFQRTQGEEIEDGWMIASIGPRFVLLVKHVPKKPDLHQALPIGQTPSTAGTQSTLPFTNAMSMPPASGLPDAASRVPIPTHANAANAPIAPVPNTKEQ